MNNDNLVWVFGLKDGILNVDKCVGMLTGVCSRSHMEGTMLEREGRGGEGRGGEGGERRGGEERGREGRGEGRGGEGRRGEERGGER